MNDTKVTARDTHNGGQGLSIGKIIHADMNAQMVPALFKQPSGPVLREDVKLVDKTNARIELRIARAARAFRGHVRADGQRVQLLRGGR